MATYRYMGEEDLQYDDANDDYTLVIVMGDEFDMYRHGKFFIVQHEDSPEILFRLTLKEAEALEQVSKELLLVKPDPENPPYLLFAPKFEVVELMYDYYNKQLFNGKCPPITIKKTRKSSVWGMASLKWAGKKPIFTFYINESAMVDRKLFTNAIVHEMIHLYMYKTGTDVLNSDPEKAMAHIHANHGPLFQKEMHRINAKGFGIIMAGTHEEYARESTEEFSVILAERGFLNGKFYRWSAWYSVEPFSQDDFHNLADMLKAEYPHETMKLQLLSTKNRITTYGTHVKGKFTPASLKKMVDVSAMAIPTGGRVVDEIYMTPSIDVKLPDVKEDIERYSLPFDKFCQAMKRYTDDKMVLRAKWKNIPVRALNKNTEERIKSLVGRMRRKAISDADILNIIQDLRAAYSGRFTVQQYRDAVMAFLKLHDGQGVLVPYYRLMGLED